MNNMERFSLTPKAKHASQTLRSVSWVVSPIAPLINQITLGGRFTLATGEANRLSCFTNEAEYRNGNDQENTAVESTPGCPCHGGGPGRGNGASSTRPIFLQFLDSNIFSLMPTRKFTSGVRH